MVKTRIIKKKKDKDNFKNAVDAVDNYSGTTSMNQDFSGKTDVNCNFFQDPGYRAHALTVPFTLCTLTYTDFWSN